MLPRENFENIWIALDCISRVFMVEKERKRVVKRRSNSPPRDLLKI